MNYGTTCHFSRQPGRGGGAKLQFCIALAAAEFVVRCVGKHTMQENEASETADNDFLKIEYQKAQDSAEHHTNLGWTVISITCAGSLVLLGLVLNNITKSDITIILIVLAVLGIVLSITMNLTDRKLGRVARQKYERCRCLEELFQGKQHQELHSPKPSMRLLVNIVTLSLAATWVSVLLFVIFYQN